MIFIPRLLRTARPLHVLVSRVTCASPVLGCSNVCHVRLFTSMARASDAESKSCVYLGSGVHRSVQASLERTKSRRALYRLSPPRALMTASYTVKTIPPLNTSRANRGVACGGSESRRESQHQRCSPAPKRDKLWYVDPFFFSTYSAPETADTFFAENTGCAME